MPHYDYACEKCGHVFEVFHKMSEKPVEKCEKCGSAVKKLIGGGSGIIFKGSGFYKTDYKKPAPAACGAPADAGAKCANCPAGPAAAGK